MDFKIKELQGIDQFDTEANIAAAKKELEEVMASSKKKKEQLRLANKEAEAALAELSNITQVHFPELPVTQPKLDMEKFLSSDRLLLESTRSLGDYSSMELIKVTLYNSLLIF